MPIGIEKTPLPFGYGVSPLAKALICVICISRKKIQNKASDGSTKYA